MKKLFSVAPILASSVSAFAAEQDLGAFLIHHSTDNRKEWDIFPGVHIPIDFHLPVTAFGYTVDLFPSLHGITLILGALITLILVVAGARYQKGLLPSGKWTHAIESLVLFIKEDILVPNFGKKDANKWFPFIGTLFMFILVLNLLGLVPGFAAATSNLGFTATLAIVVFVLFNGLGMKKNGIFGYWFGLVPSGLPLKPVMVPVLFVLELINVISKTFALAIRIFANMLAGHMMISALMALIVMFGWYYSFVIVPFTVAIFVLKILIACLQAFVFAILTSLFIGSAIHQEH